MHCKITSCDILSDALAAIGVPLDLRCGGQGTCGRCRVKLLTGRWRTATGSPISVPAWVPACRTRLVDGAGEVEVPVSAIGGRSGQIADLWEGASLPATDESVIGIDLGTTTVAAVKICRGRVVGRASGFNLQNRCGGDNVIDRIVRCRRDLAGQRQAAADSINALLEELGFSDVKRMAVAANSVMTLILHGIDPTSLGTSPFTLPQRDFPVRGGAELGLCVDVPVLTAPLASGYIGGDLVCGLAETHLADGEMLLDLGTNCEMVLRMGDRLVGSSSAAGPAFEGGGISCGVRAVAGAIDHYFGPGKFSIISGVSEPIGLCGSALLDYLAVERAAGRLNRFGRFQPEAASGLVGGGLRVTERDIEALLKAKAAIRSGLAALETHCGIQVKKLCLAGGFARYLDLFNAFFVDLLPDRDCATVGNVSLGGAARLAAAPRHLAELKRFRDAVEEVPLNLISGFESAYIDALLLP